eukprot:169620_1
MQSSIISDYFLGNINVSKFSIVTNEVLTEYKQKLELDHNILLTALRTNYEYQVAECTRQYQFIKSHLDQELQSRGSSVPNSQFIIDNQSLFASNPNLPPDVLPPITPLNFPLLPMDVALGTNNNNISDISITSLLPPPISQPLPIKQSAMIQMPPNNSCINGVNMNVKGQNPQTYHAAPKAEPDDEALVIQILAEMRQTHINGQLDTINAQDGCMVKAQDDYNTEIKLKSEETRVIKKEEPKFKMDIKSLPMIPLHYIKDEKAMKKRKRVKKEGILHQCEYPDCGYKTSNQAHLRKHIRTHTDERPFQCEICQKAFKQKSNLKTHVRIHTGQRPFECRVCRKTFTQRSSLVQHEKIHSGDKPFVCVWPGCGKQFKRKDHLKSHQRVHTGEKPEKCEWDECDKRFATPQQLRLHMMDHTGIRPFVCDHAGCGKSFKTKSLLSRHKDTHLDVKPFLCHLCGKGFTRKAHFSKHLRDKHTIATDEEGDTMQMQDLPPYFQAFGVHPTNGNELLQMEVLPPPSVDTHTANGNDVFQMQVVPPSVDEHPTNGNGLLQMQVLLDSVDTDPTNRHINSDALPVQDLPPSL